jgi:hypothetical protein
LLAVGGPGNAEDVGAVWIFTRTGLSWSQPGEKLQGTRGVYNTGSMLQGKSTAISSDGNTTVFGGELFGNGIGAFWAYVN